MNRFMTNNGTHKRLLFLLLFGLTNVIVLFLLTRKIEGWKMSNKTRFSKETGYLERILKRQKLWQDIIQYNNDNKMNETKRLPKVIGIGIKKCGTDGVISFLNHHPLVRVPPGGEIFFFNSGNTNYDTYRMRMPPTNGRQVAMEKTPIYFSAQPEDIPRRIKMAIPDVKLILIVCDPTKRAFSDYHHERERYRLFNVKFMAKYETFRDYVDVHLPKLQNKMKEWKAQNTSQNHGSLRMKLIELAKADPASTTLSNGLYTAHIGRWKSVFNESNLKIIEGKQFMENPGAIMEDLQDFIGLPKLLLREDFVKRPDTGFYCYRRFTEEHLRNHSQAENVKNLKCLADTKGRTRNSKKTASPEILEKLREFFRPYNELFYEDIGENFGWK